jgi:hypothetical protein
MAVINPPGWLQNAGATHTAEQMRNWVSMLSSAPVGATSLVAAGGVQPYLANTLQVTQTGSPSMAVIIKSGVVIIPGSEGSKQGAYFALNDADLTVSVTAAHATLARIDSVAFKVEDSQYSGANNTSSLVVIAGTPAGSPVAPTLPNNCIELAQIAVAALATTITNANITDKRKYYAGVGGLIKCTSTTRPSFPKEGMSIYETDTSSIYAYNGSVWNLIWTMSAWTTYAVVWAGAGTAVVLGNGTLVGKYRQEGKKVTVRIILTAGTTTTFGNSFFTFTLPVASVADKQCGVAIFQDSGVLDRIGAVYTLSTTTITLVTSAGGVATNTAPHTWGNTDVMIIQITYEAA